MGEVKTDLRCGYCGSWKSADRFLEHVHACEKIKSEEIRNKKLLDDANNQSDG